MASVLLADDEELVLQTFKEALELDGHQVVVTRNGQDMLPLIEKHGIEVVVTDILMPDVDGLESIRDIRKHYPRVGIVAISGGGRTRHLEFLDHARKLGADIALAKPFLGHALLNAVNLCASRQTLPTGPGSAST